MEHLLRYVKQVLGYNNARYKGIMKKRQNLYAIGFFQFVNHRQASRVIGLVRLKLGKTGKSGEKRSRVACENE